MKYSEVLLADTEQKAEESLALVCLAAPDKITVQYEHLFSLYFLFFLGGGMRIILLK